MFTNKAVVKKLPSRTFRWCRLLLKGFLRCCFVCSWSRPTSWSTTPASTETSAVSSVSRASCSLVTRLCASGTWFTSWSCGASPASTPSSLQVTPAAVQALLGHIVDMDEKMSSCNYKAKDKLLKASVASLSYHQSQTFLTWMPWLPTSHWLWSAFTVPSTHGSTSTKYQSCSKKSRYGQHLLPFANMVNGLLLLKK